MPTQIVPPVLLLEEATSAQKQRGMASLCPREDEIYLWRCGGHLVGAFPTVNEELLYFWAMPIIWTRLQTLKCKPRHSAVHDS